MSNTKVVYWIGAGASANALPVVGEMPAAFRRQALLLTDRMEDGLQALFISEETRRYSEYLQKMAEWSVQYGTIDTYAKSLFLLKKANELAALKMHLSIYFMLDQLLERPKLRRDEKELTAEKRDHIDTRYMGWLALLMEPASIINKNIRVISWNYDLQIDHAVAQFKGAQDFSNVYDDKELFFPSLRPDVNSPIAPSIIRLNGVAGFAKFGPRTSTLYKGNLGTKEGKQECIARIFSLYKGYDEKEQSMLNSAIDTFTFAWERTPIALKAFEYAKYAMMDANILVVIGYSFPSFNRKVDKELYTAFTNNMSEAKKVVVQSPTMTSDTFRQIMGIRSPIPSVVVEHNTDQFYIPPEFF